MAERISIRLPRAIARDEESIRRTLGACGPWVQVGEASARARDVGGQRTVPRGEQVVGDQLMESHASRFGRLA